MVVPKNVSINLLKDISKTDIWRNKEFELVFEGQKFSWVKHELQVYNYIILYCISNIAKHIRERGTPQKGFFCKKNSVTSMRDYFILDHIRIKAGLGRYNLSRRYFSPTRILSKYFLAIISYMLSRWDDIGLICKRNYYKLSISCPL